ncbi:MAG: hypothetical protein STSR0009_05590 [Methanoregula sp.]
MIKAGTGLESLAITDDDCIILKRGEAYQQESDILVMQGTEGGNIAIRKHRGAVGVGPPCQKIRMVKTPESSCTAAELPMFKVIRIQHDASLHAHWIGVDLNTTGHAVVAADLRSGEVMKLGKIMQYSSTTSTMNCTKLFRKNKLWKLTRMKTREKKEFKASLHKIARQIVRFAESACAGIKFEKLFSYRHLHHREMEDSYEFSFENGSFVSLLHLVEKQALTYGIPVMYVNPANTSKRCSRCGAFGTRIRKMFRCPQCERTIHADVNAAFNIAAMPCSSDKAKLHEQRTSRKIMRRLARAGEIPHESRIPAVVDLSSHRQMLSRWDEAPEVLGEG